MHHGVSCWLQAGEEGALPTVRILRTTSPFGIFAAYRRDNGMDEWPGLADKMSPRMAEKLPEAVHLKAWFRGIARYEREGRMDELFAMLPPPPLLIEFVASTREGRHDTLYPDFLDFDHKAGGAIMMKRLVKRFQERGDLVTMYTHPLWWHADSDSVAGLGGPEAIGVRSRSGDLVTEVSSGSEGFAVGVWREPVRAFVVNQLEELRDEFGFDMIFLDQIGARNDYDFSTEFGRPPYAWIQSVFDLTALAASILPVSGEGVGPDRSHRDLTASFGYYLTTMSRTRDRFYDRQHRAGNTVQWPFATMVLHDKIAFYPHNLERTDRQRPGMGLDHISWCLAAGMNLHTTMEEVLADKEAPDVGNRRFLALAHIQRAVCSRFFGQGITDFTFTSRSPEVTRTEFANGLVIHASHDDHPQTLPSGAATVRVPPHGFLVEQDGVPVFAVRESDAAPKGMLSEWDPKNARWVDIMPYVEREAAP